MRHSGNSGFTLIEVLISIMIMAVIAHGTYALMSTTFTASQTVEEDTASFHAFHKAMNILNQDFVQMVPRVARMDGSPSRMIIQTGENMFQSEGTGISFMRGGALNPGAELPRGEIVRVWYRVKNGQLERAVYPYPDTVIGYEPQFYPLMKGVKNFKVFFYRQGSWSQGWIDRVKISSGVKVEFESEAYGKISRIFYVPAGDV